MNKKRQPSETKINSQKGDWRKPLPSVARQRTKYRIELESLNTPFHNQLRDRTIAWLEKNVPPRRLKHILGVEQMCYELACIHQIDHYRAATAGLMHDLAKYFSPQLLLSMAEAEGIAIDEICQNHPHLLHADVSAIVARDEFGIKDREIIEAIANHTLGKPEMSDLSCVVFVADALEPSRGNKPELESMRLTSTKNLYKTVQQTIDYSLKCLLNSSKVIHPRTVWTRNWALQKVRKK